MEKSGDKPVGPAQSLKVSEKGDDAAAKTDAEGQFVRRKPGSNPNPSRNPDGLHSANPVVTSGNGDATQPLKRKPEAE